MPLPKAARQRSRRDDRRSGWNARALIVVINGLIISVSGVYLATKSIVVTVVSGVLAVILAGWLASIGR